MKKAGYGTGEMTQWLKAMAVFLEDWGSIPVPTWWLTTSVGPIAKDPVPSFGLCGHWVRTDI